MTATTLLTLGTGRTLEARGGYEDLTTYLAPRTLTADDGRRELTLADGRKVTLNATAVLMIEEAAANDDRHPLGFR